MSIIPLGIFRIAIMFAGVAVSCLFMTRNIAVDNVKLRVLLYGVICGSQAIYGMLLLINFYNAA